jgi:hypothetical protein
MAVTNEEGIAKGVRVPSYLSVSSNPLKRIQELNGRDGFPASNRVAKKGAPYWILKLVVGPFAQGARQLAIDWAGNSRKVACRILYAVQMARRVNACLAKHASEAELLSDVGCVPVGPVVIWTDNTSELESLLQTSQAKPRKRVRV